MKKRILIIDDDIELCEELVDALTCEGCQVETAHDGSFGLALACEHDYDAIVLDLKMPGMNGAEILKKLGGKSDRPKLFLITARPEIEKFIAEEHLSDLVDVVMNKPFDIDILLREIKKINR